MVNKKTTTAGILTIALTIIKVVLEYLNSQPIDAVGAGAGLVAGIGLLGAKDHNVTGGTVQQ